MGNWTVTGELGAGKTILSVGKAREFLLEDKRLASNVDLFLEWLMPPMSKATYTRLTDFPETDEMIALGKGGDSPKESSFGCLWLDELAMFLNARSWQKDGRDSFIIFQRHLRKLRWHTLFTVQDVDSIDKQARNALVERVVRAGRTDRVRIPIIGGVLQFIGLSGMRAQKHIGYVYYGKSVGPHAKWHEKWEYRGDSLYNAYNTEQAFSPLQEITHTYQDGRKEQIKIGYWREWRTYGKHEPVTVYDVQIDAPYTVLSAWHLYGRYLSFYQLHQTKIRIFTAMITLLLAAFVAFSAVPSKEKLPINTCVTPDSYIINGNHAAVLYDNIVINATLKDNKLVAHHQCFNLGK